MVGAAELPLPQRPKLSRLASHGQREAPAQKNNFYAPIGRIPQCRYARFAHIQKAPDRAGITSQIGAYPRGARKHLMCRMSDEPLRLPPGYILDESCPDILVLRRPDGTTAAVFSALAATPQAIEEAAREDHERR